MSDYSELHAIENLRRAYRWILSNPEARHKNFFRDSYTAYALSSERNLEALRDVLRMGTFEPSHASRVFVPKPSGVLRPFSLLCMDDQIVYQACANIIAERLKPRTTKRYRTRVFNHLYAGRRSHFFYLKWQDSYREFSRAVRSQRLQIG